MKINMLPPLHQSIFKSPVGDLKLQASVAGLTHLQVIGKDSHAANYSLSSEIKAATGADISQAKQWIEQAIHELEEYFSGQRVHFDVPLAAKGTEFQQQVWQALVDLPFGKVCSYGDIANKIERPRAVRAVGAANGANPIAIIVPCHRVIGKNGTLTGYAYGLEMKQFLLNLESR
ncbi:MULTISPECIES: methylated-DNA--[protein]-cysteine S-methyltransferase [Shewanella]|uniref:methylated-DNA--[protein]-cysteine S-methyltransferase n=1 Tax=Shewanella TaxID=22 RepID=UPI0009ED8027|nr:MULTISPECIES: methylated-DNA--[protein]-cysteine S-methyltransferase [Shewanella]